MGHDINKKLKITSFLGERPTKVIEYAELLDKPDIDTINSVNTYLGKMFVAAELQELGITYIDSLYLSLKHPIIVLDKNVYLPLKLSIKGLLYNDMSKKLKIGYYNSNSVFYVEGVGKRPNIKHLLKHFKKLLSSIYTGSTQNRTGRYVICLDNANRNFLQALLHFAIEGNGETIDYTWIAPLQNLIEDKLEAELKVKIKNKKNSTNTFSGMKEEVEDGDWLETATIPTKQAMFYSNPYEKAVQEIKRTVQRGKFSTTSTKIVLPPTKSFIEKNITNEVKKEQF